MAVIIKDIVEKARVSYSTMFGTFNDTEAESTENKERILKLARETGYVPNQTAISLKLSRSYTIGLYFSITSKMSSPFVLHDVLTGVYSIVGSKYNVVVKGVDMHEKGMLNPSFYDGITVLSQRTEDGELIEEVVAKDTPMVAICRTVFYDVPNVVTDEAKAMEMATDYLLEHDHRKIGVIRGNPNLDSTRLGEQGWRNSMLKHGLDPNDLPVEIGNYRYVSSCQAAKKLVEEHQGLTAILCFDDEMVFATRATVYKVGLMVPDDVSLIGFGNWDMSGYGSTKLTTVGCSMSEVAEEGARVLLRRPEDGIMDNRRVYLDNKLIARETVRDIR